MIDKIVFGTTNYSVGKHPKLTIVPAYVDGSTGEPKRSGILWVSELRSQHGKKAFHNYPGMEITINPGDEHKPSVLYGACNPSVLIHGNNYYPVTSSELAASLAKAKRILINAGITINIDDCKLYRIDLCKNVELTHDFTKYIPALNLISPMYMPQIVPSIYDGSYTKGNKSSEFGAYDKKKELIEKQHIDPASLGIHEKHIGRFELRYIKGRSVKTNLGIEFMRDLKHRNALSDLASRFNDIMENRIFRIGKSVDGVVVEDAGEELFSQIVNKYGKGAYELFFIHKQMTGKKPLSIDILESYMIKSGLSRATIDGRKKRHLAVLKMGIAIKSDPLSISELLGELHRKLLV